MVNWDRVKDLYEEVGAEDFDEIVELFFEEVEGVVARLKEHPDPSTLGKDLHFLKGSAVSIGFSHFSELCGAGETAAENGQATTIDLQQISSAFDVSKVEFLAGLHQVKAA